MVDYIYWRDESGAHSVPVRDSSTSEKIARRLAEQGKKVIVTKDSSDIKHATSTKGYRKSKSTGKVIEESGKTEKPTQMAEKDLDYYTTTLINAGRLERAREDIIQNAKLQLKQMHERGEKIDESTVQRVLQEAQSRYIEKKPVYLYQQKFVTTDTTAPPSPPPKTKPKTDFRENIIFKSVIGSYEKAVSSIKKDKQLLQESAKSLTLGYKPSYQESMIINEPVDISKIKPSKEPIKAVFDVRQPRSIKIDTRTKTEKFKDEITEKVKKGAEEINKFFTKASPEFTNIAVKPSVSFFTGFGTGMIKSSIDIGSGLASFVKRPVKTSKEMSSSVFSAVSHPVKTTKSIGEAISKKGEQLGKELDTDLSAFTYDVGQMGGKVTTYYLASKGFSKSFEKVSKTMSDLFKTQVKKINYRIKKVLPYTKEYQLRSITGYSGKGSGSIPMSRLRVTLDKVDDIPEKYVILQKRAVRLVSTSPETSKVVTTTSYDVLTKKQLKALLKRSARGRMAVPTEYSAREYAIVGYSKKPVIPKELKTRVTTKDLIQPYKTSPVGYFSQSEEFYKKNIAEFTKMKQGVYFTDKTMTITIPSKFSQFISKIKTGKPTAQIKKQISAISDKFNKVSKKITTGTKKTATILEKPITKISLGFGGKTIKTVKSIKTISKVPSALTKISAGLDIFGKSLLFSTAFKSDSKIKQTSKDVFSLNKQYKKEITNIEQKMKSITMPKIETKQLQMMKYRFKGFEKIGGIGKLKFPERESMKTRMKFAVRTDFAMKMTQQAPQIFKPKLMPPAVTSKSIFPIFPKDIKKFSLAPKKKKKKSTRWEKINPWAKVKRVRL